MRTTLRVLLIIIGSLGLITFVQDSLYFTLIGAGSTTGILIGIGGLVVAIICWRVHSRLFEIKEVKPRQESDKEWMERELGSLVGKRK